MNTITIRTSRDKAWTLFKLLDKYADSYEGIKLYEEENEVEVRCNIKKFLFSYNLGMNKFRKQMKKALS